MMMLLMMPRVIMTDHSIVIGKTYLRYRVTKAKKAARARIFVLPGFTEFIEKHEDQTQGFAAMGLDVLTIDWLGQGLSTRMTSHPHTIHINSFDKHLESLLAAAEDAGFLDGDLPLIVYGHSMGGHLALRFGQMLAAINAPRLKIAGVIISAPMIMPPKSPPRLILAYATIICALGFGRKSVFSQKKIDAQIKLQLSLARDGEFAPENELTRNPKGYWVQCDLFTKNPHLRAHGPSFGWVRAAYASCLATSGNLSWMQAYDLPVQAHLAGDETVVNVSYSATYLRQIVRAEVYEYPKAKHELMLELDEVQGMIWARMAEFINKNLNQ